MNKTARKKTFLSSFSVFHIIIIAICASLGIAIKPIVVPLIHVITGPLFLPGGAVAGGLYMLFIVVASGLTRKIGAATLTCAIQAILVIVTGVIGSHGIFSILTYVLPGVMVDLFLLVSRHRCCCAMCCFFSGLIANLTGTMMSNLIFFRLPLIPLLLVLFAAALSGGLGGLIASGIIKKVRTLNPIFQNNNDTKGES